MLNWLHEFRGMILDPNTGEQRIPWNLMPQYWTHQAKLYGKDEWYEHGLYLTGPIAKTYDETAAGLDDLLATHGYVRDGALYKCAENTEKTIVLFCHFAIGMTMLSHMLGVSPAVMWHSFFMPTSSVTTLITEERVRSEVFFKCMQLGDTSHLYAASEPVSRSGLFQERYGLSGITVAQ